VTHSQRRYDVLLWGATGFTGQLVAEYLARHYGVGKSLRWAIGGRSRAKLEKVRAALEAIDPAARDLPLLLGDSADRASLDPLAADARVVCTTVGPYGLYGRELVAACVEAGTDYCDLTGETPFIREMIDLHHARAQATGARIVHCCGYDSIPSDLGVLMLQEHMKRAQGARCAAVKYFAGESKMGISGGTAASMVHIVEQASRDPRVRAVVDDPYALVPGAAPGPDGADQRGVRWDDDLRRWTGPFLMAAINTRVVRRSNALLDYAYGRDFRYSEATSLRAGPRGWLTAAGLSAGIATFTAALEIAAVRDVVAKRVLPAPGEGPSKEVRDSGFFVSRLVGVGEGRDGSSPAKLLGTVRGTSDPGYGETAKMLSESAVCLATGDGERRGGVLTPAAAMGMPLVDRLRTAGMTFEVAEAPARA
jgi:short subunit dehydrogenase-like uncharacterized protein